MARLPVPGQDSGDWGTILNNFLKVSLNSSGQIKSSAITNAGGQLTNKKGQASGYASLNSSGVVPNSQLPTMLTGVGDYVGVYSSPFVENGAYPGVEWEGVTATRGNSVSLNVDNPMRVDVETDGVYAVTAMVQWGDQNTENPGGRSIHIFANCGFYVTDQRERNPVAGVQNYQTVNYTVFMQANTSFTCSINQTGETSLNPYVMMLVTRVA